MLCRTLLGCIDKAVIPLVVFFFNFFSIFISIATKKRNARAINCCLEYFIISKVVMLTCSGVFEENRPTLMTWRLWHMREHVNNYIRNVQQTTSALNIWPFQRSCYHLLMAYLNKSVPNLCLVEEIKRVNNPLTVTYSRFSASGETCSSSKSAFVIKNSSFTLSSLLHLTVHLKYICDPK